jgi:hypothetical protein
MEGRHLLPFVRANLSAYEGGHEGAIRLLGISGRERLNDDSFECYIKYLVAFREGVQLATIAELRAYPRCEVAVRFEGEHVRSLLSVSSEGELEVLEEPED